MKKILYFTLTLILCFVSFKYGQNECYDHSDNLEELGLSSDSLSRIIVNQDSNVFCLYPSYLFEEGLFYDFKGIGMAIYCSGRFDDGDASYEVYRCIKSWDIDNGLDSLDNDSKAIALHYLRKAAMQNNTQAKDEINSIHLVDEDNHQYKHQMCGSNDVINFK